MGPQVEKKYIIVSVVLHLGILLVLMLGLDESTSLPVFENTNKHDVISAVVLGESATSKILPKQVTPEPPQATPIQQEPPKPQPEVAKQAPVEKEVIALKKMVDKKKLEKEKALEALKKPSLFGKDLLADIKKQKSKEKLKQKQIQSQLQKTLFEKSEKTLREQLLNEKIKVLGAISRQAQGEVDKYKALMLQAIAEKWVVPLQANKHLSTVLMIRVAKGGMVLDVQVTKTSGDPALDSSARAAVLKASPLPVPEDALAFDAFRQFVLKLKPENVMGLS